MALRTISREDRMQNAAKSSPGRMYRLQCSCEPTESTPLCGRPAFAPYSILMRKWGKTHSITFRGLPETKYRSFSH